MPGSRAPGRGAGARARRGRARGGRHRCTRCVNLRGVARPARRAAGRGRAGDRRAAGARRGAPRRSGARRAARPARCPRPRGARPRRRLDRRHRRTSSAPSRTATPGCGCCAAPRRPRGCRASRTPAPSSRPRRGGACWCSSTPTCCWRRTPSRPRSRCCAAPGSTCSRPWPRQLADGAAARLVQPLLQWSWMVSLPLRRAERSAQPGAVRRQRAVPRRRRRGAGAGGRVRRGRRGGARRPRGRPRGQARRRAGRGGRRRRARGLPDVRRLGGPARRVPQVAVGGVRARPGVRGRRRDAGAGLRRAAAGRPARVTGRAGRLRRRGGEPGAGRRAAAAAGPGPTRWPTPCRWRRCWGCWRRRGAGTAGAS